MTRLRWHARQPVWPPQRRSEISLTPRNWRFGWAHARLMPSVCRRVLPTAAASGHRSGLGVIRRNCLIAFGPPAIRNRASRPQSWQRDQTFDTAFVRTRCVVRRKCSSASQGTGLAVERNPKRPNARRQCLPISVALPRQVLGCRAACASPPSITDRFLKAVRDGWLGFSPRRHWLRGTRWSSKRAPWTTLTHLRQEYGSCPVDDVSSLCGLAGRFALERPGRVCTSRLIWMAGSLADCCRPVWAPSRGSDGELGIRPQSPLASGVFAWRIRRSLPARPNDLQRDSPRLIPRGLRGARSGVGAPGRRDRLVLPSPAKIGLLRDGCPGAARETLRGRRVQRRGPWSASAVRAVRASDRAGQVGPHRRQYQIRRAGSPDPRPSRWSVKTNVVVTCRYEPFGICSASLPRSLAFGLSACWPMRVGVLR